jgi:hypothetical protein
MFFIYRSLQFVRLGAGEKMRAGSDVTILFCPPKLNMAAGGFRPVLTKKKPVSDHSCCDATGVCLFIGREATSLGRCARWLRVSE